MNFVEHPSNHKRFFTDEAVAILRDIMWGFDLRQKRFVTLLCHFSVFFLRRVPLQVLPLPFLLSPGAHPLFSIASIR